MQGSSLAYGIRCATSWGSCPNGETLHDVWVVIRSATVTLEDLEAPVVWAVETAGLADGQWHRGAGTLTFSATDNTGIRGRRVLEGAVTRASVVAPGASAGGCGEPGLGEAYTYLQPCAGARGLNGRLAVQVADVCSWGDGVHSVNGAATDTGGAEVVSSASATVRVDCTAPVVAICPTGDREVAAGTVVAPVVSAQDVRVAVASTEVQTQIGTQAWVPYTGGVVAQAGSYYRFRARDRRSRQHEAGWV